ncbi:uncharacterized protein LOC121732424 isoform X7 [Aricia agestis]|uniref:uncharacterized protein LOC121732424 isoform X7 n=1 Tax=Aricia agestis TaxID=91739 RepID=UPI001C206C6E|nr:uncharacterized protein LOC121732424 isoform X7 [Aricia agestis]
MKPLTLLSLSELKWWFAHSRSKREMSAASGLKHVATEPAQLDNKRERRRGNSTRAAGRAAALRRVPSDSDCSVETASLSADSGDRSVRPPPPPVRTSKSRSRRRGSEWEVLEGLKDGQRFDKRPEVFNGYLHKKRKWPLKGWHKRFFVVDGGILVYARSAGDVARGRLHGSVDVGLSVLSAKPRRRRIDIDADEFIYHLRAKTHDAFRTWLHVLKTHRLYRQHLLTFGARESVPKIHAPLDDIPPNENSSRMMTSKEHKEVPKHASNKYPESKLLSSKTKKKCRTRPYYSHSKVSSKEKPYFVSLCSWSAGKEKTKLDFSNQIAFIKSSIRKHSPNFSLAKNKKEKSKRQKGKTENKQIKKASEGGNKTISKNIIKNSTVSRFIDTNKSDNQKIRRIKKSTNVIKYQNKFYEPVLTNAYNFVALKNSKRIVSGSNSYSLSFNEKKVLKNWNSRVRNINNLNKLEYDMMVKKVIQLLSDKINEEKEIPTTRAYLNEVFEEMSGTKLHSENENSLKELFKYLLQFWLKTTTTLTDADIKRHNDIKANKCTSNTHVSSCSVATQAYDYEDGLIKCDTFIKEKHDSDLEKVLNNIVYKCESTNTLFDAKRISNNNLRREQKITQTMDRLESIKISKFKKTLSRLLSKIPISAETALEILQLYLEIIDDDSENFNTNNATTKNIKPKLMPSNISNNINSDYENTSEINLRRVCNTEHENNSINVFDSRKGFGKYETDLNDNANNNLFKSINVLDMKKATPNNNIGINILVYTNLLRTVYNNPRKPVDERVMLLLLDNLLPLSKSTTIHKDINNLCMKLRRKFGKNTEEHGLSLLGKIYADVVKNSTTDQYTSTNTDLRDESNNDFLELQYDDKSTQYILNEDKL